MALDKEDLKAIANGVLGRLLPILAPPRSQNDPYRKETETEWHARYEIETRALRKLRHEGDQMDIQIRELSLKIPAQFRPLPEQYRSHDRKVHVLELVKDPARWPMIPPIKMQWPNRKRSNWENGIGRSPSEISFGPWERADEMGGCDLSESDVASAGGRPTMTLTKGDITAIVDEVLRRLIPILGRHKPKEKSSVDVVGLLREMELDLIKWRELRAEDNRKDIQIRELSLKMPAELRPLPEQYRSSRRKDHVLELVQDPTRWVMIPALSKQWPSRKKIAGDEGDCKKK